MNNIEDAFNDKKIKKAVRKAKLKLTLKIVIISTLVFIIGSYLNFKIFINYSEKAYEENEAIVQLSVPNGYISESNDICGFLGGSGNYKVAKDIGGKTIILKDGISLFGLIPPMNYSRGQGGGYHVAGEWPVSLWEYGYKKMRFFHPEIKYKEYQNDIGNIESMPDGKIIEMGISFNKPYSIHEMDIIQNEFKDVKVTWAWLDEFEDKKLEELNKEAKENDGKASGIYENEIVGIGIDDKYIVDYDKEYDELLNNLNKSSYHTYKNLYTEIMKRGKTTADKAKVLGVVVQGTKEDLSKLKGNSRIKASSIGIVTDKLY
ncbi:anti sigma factor C-terminal domain-containing protein [Clostridium sp. YIM B02555]|uniref:anti sigma factor C-terminal domain-containing protein n=1 Tax=Clostridium sp. YIM B02555 TaxID=2911968 RepID=UPI001EEEAE77|nr:anti sigma factor C-terminal domain-containing protein [Clostridium sp. YIM B02555]